MTGSRDLWRMAACLAVGSVCSAPRHALATEPDPRPPLPEPAELPELPPWERHLEVAGGVILVDRPLLHEREPSAVSYRPGIGFGMHLRWAVLPFLQVRPYFIDVHHDVSLPHGALTTGTSSSLASSAVLSDTVTTTFAFGLQVQPTWSLSSRARAWLTAGIGWGRMEFPEMTAQEGSSAAFLIRERSSVFVEFPFGMGASFDIIERWLALEYDATAAPITGQSGTALESFQTVDAAGQLRDVGPFEALDVSFVHSLSLALIL